MNILMHKLKQRHWKSAVEKQQPPASGTSKIAKVVPSGAVLLKNALARSVAQLAERLSMFRTGGLIPESGNYRVQHTEHHLPHEVTLLRDQKFPRCAKCNNAVSFDLIQAEGAGSLDALGQGRRICLYELPELEEESA
jgi:hypothetical protein